MTYYHVNDPLAVIYNEGYWRINRVSQMFSLSYTPIKLKQYSMKIRQAIVGEVAASSNSNYSAVVESLPLLKYSADDPGGLMITVSSVVKDRSNRNNNKEVYVALILSWGLYTSVNEGSTNLPFMLERGEQKVGVAVKTTLRKLFDCNIVQYNFTQHQLLQFGFNFVENDTSRSTDPFTLTYKTPQVNFKDKVILSFEIGDIHRIWNRTKSRHDQDFDIYSLAYEKLHHQIYNMVTLDINVFDLCEVALPKAEVKSTGVVKVKTPTMINALFNVLNEFIRAEVENNHDIE